MGLTGECQNNIGLFYQSFLKQAHCVYVWAIMLISVPNIIFLTNFGALKEIKNKFTQKGQFFLQTQLIISSTQPAQQTDMHCHTHTHSTLTHAAGTSLHSTTPTNLSTPCMPDYQQSLTLSYAQPLYSFTRLIAAQGLGQLVC